MDIKEVNSLLPFLLKRENVARYEDGVIIICDRRKYPFSKEFVHCEDVESAAQAIENMVTQGGGPQYVALFAMALAARQASSGSPDSQIDSLTMTSKRLIKTRPTNTSLARHIENALQAAKKWIKAGKSVETELLTWIEQIRDQSYEKHLLCAEFGNSLIKDGDGVLTMCFAETSFILSLALAKESGKKIQVFTPETRPYLQGARLTAPCVHELGIPVKVISDNMPTHVISQGKIQIFMTAADLITLDGHVVNKVGTFQNAIAAHAHGVPYFVFTQAADRKKPDRSSIEIEERDPAEIRLCRGTPTTIDEIDAYYPAFDITPPHYVAGVISQHGILSAYDLHRYFG